MKDLIEALQLLQTLMKNPNEEFPTQCCHDVLYVWGVDWNKAKFSDVQRLVKLGFYPGWDENSSFLDDLFGTDCFDWDEVTEEQWKVILEYELDDCCYSYRYGSC